MVSQFFRLFSGRTPSSLRDRRGCPPFLKKGFFLIVILCLLWPFHGVEAEGLVRDVEASHQWYSLGKYHFQFRKDLQKSREALLKALEKDPQNFLAFEMLQDVERRLRREEAIKGNSSEEGAGRLGGESMQWYDNALYHWEKNRDVKETVRCLEKALEINPFNTKAIALLKTVKEENPEYAREDSALPGVAVQADPAGKYQAIARTQEAQQWFVNSTYHFKKGNFARALSAIEKALSLAPDLKTAQEMRDRILQARSKQEKIAIESSLEHTAASLEGKTPEGGKASHWFWLGKYYFSVKQDFKGALECFERAALIDPAHAETQEMINKAKLKLYFVTDGSAVRIVDNRPKAARAKGKKTADSETPDSSGSDSSNQAAEKPSEKKKPDPAAVEAEEIELVGDYEFAATEEGARPTGSVIPTEARKIVKTPYELWMERRKSFEDMGKILFAESWKETEKEDRKTTAPGTSSGERNRKRDVESELEEMWNSIQRGEKSSQTTQSGTSGSRAQASGGKLSAQVASAVAGLDIGGMKPKDQYQVTSQEEAVMAVTSSAEARPIPPDLKEQIKESILTAEDLARQGKNQEAMAIYEEAFLTLVKYDPENLEALYNLLLVNIRQDDNDFATLLMFRLLGMMGTIGNETELHKSIREIVFCFVKGTILQSAISAYNNNVDPMERMSNGTFSLDVLRRAGLLATGDVPYELSLKIGDRKITAGIAIENFKCPAGGKYQIGRDGFVRCTVHGMSPYLRMRTGKASSE